MGSDESEVQYYGIGCLPLHDDIWGISMASSRCTWFRNYIFRFFPRVEDFPVGYVGKKKRLNWYESSVHLMGFAPLKKSKWIYAQRFAAAIDARLWMPHFCDCIHHPYPDGDEEGESGINILEWRTEYWSEKPWCAHQTWLELQFYACSCAHCSLLAARWQWALRCKRVFVLELKILTFVQLNGARSSELSAA